MSLLLISRFLIMRLLNSNFKEFKIFIYCRWSELVAIVSLSTTLFLFIHTRELSVQLDLEKTRHSGSEAGDSSDLILVEDIRTELENERAKYGKLDPEALNNTKKANKDLLFFNRVPKVGSQTTMELIKTLAIKNDYHYHKDRTQKVETIKLTRSEEVKKG